MMGVMDIQQEVKTVEKELLELIINHLKKHTLDLETAQKLAKDFLALLPIQDQQDLLNKLKALGGHYDEAQQLYVDEMSRVSDEERNSVLNRMRDAIKQGNIDHAILVARSKQGGVS